MKKSKKEPIQEKLKPCPFCGSTPFLNEHYPMVNGHTLWQVGCEEISCPIDDVWGAGYSRKGLAIKAWNTRVSDE